MSKQQTRIFDEKNKIYIDKSLSSFTSSSNVAGISTPSTSGITQITRVSDQLKNEIEHSLLTYFSGMQNLDAVFDEFSKNLIAFIHQTDEVAMLNLWSGNSATGKTQMAKRLSGFEGFKPLAIKGIRTFYFDAYQIRDNFEQIKKDIADKSKFPNNSIVFIDEIEKILDITHKVADESFVQKFRKFIEDLNTTRKLMVIFIMQPKAGRNDVLRLFENKLTSVMDFDTQFPDWTQESLIQVIFENVEKRKYKIDNEAAAILAGHCLKYGSIVELLGVIKHLEVELKHSGRNHIDAGLIQSVTKNRG